MLPPMANIRLQVLSDLHLESPAAYDIFSIEPKAPFLALLGDIGYVKDEGFFPFLRRQLSIFRVVFLVLGNHEAYHSSWTETKSNLERFKEELDEASGRDEALGKLVLLDQTRYDISPTLTILGCTLFSYITEEQMESVSFGLNDFYHIRDWSVEAHREAHAADLSWLNAEIDSISRLEPGRKVIIFTHYCPSTHEEVVDPRHSNSKISSGFMTDLLNEQCWQSEIVTLWAFGHTHFNCDFRDVTTGKRVMANQRGYYFSQSTGFNAEKVVELKDT
jgi:predicted phosphodiesterase